VSAGSSRARSRGTDDHAGFEVPPGSLEMFARLGIPFSVSAIVT